MVFCDLILACILYQESCEPFAAFEERAFRTSGDTMAV
jgi:hypothetical protein